MIYSEYYDTKEIEKVWKSLKIDKAFHFFKLEDIFTNDYSLYMSIRKDAGKTTNALILALILHKIYGITCEYVRNDTAQTTIDSTSKLFETIKYFGYIEKIFKIYNDVEYSGRTKEFTLVWRSSEGEIERREGESFLGVKSNEKWLSYKSTYNRPKTWLIIWDEFLDSTRPHGKILSELMDNISTFTRDNPRAHVIGLSNTVNKYDAIFDDFAITNDLEHMEFGEYKNIISALGTTLHVELLPVSASRKQSIKDKHIRFYGFNNNKFAHLTGVEAWKGFNYPHLKDEAVKDYTLQYFIHHRDRWLSLSVIEFEDQDKQLAFLVAKSSPPKYMDRIIFTLNPALVNEKLITSCSTFLKACINEGRLYFSSNEVGMLFDDFMRESGIKMFRR